MHRELWKSVPIKHTYLGLYDGPHATPKEAADGPIFLGIRNLTEDGQLDLSEIRHIAEEDFPAWTRRVLPRPGDIVFCYEAALNRYAIIPDGFRGCLGRRLALIRPNPQVVDTRFLFFSFFSPQWRTTIATRLLPGTTVDRIPLVSFPDFPITLPPLPLQRTIGGILSAYHDLIDKNTRRIANLEERARLLYNEWFVKFRFPGHEHVRLVESEVGMVPQGWEVVKLGDVMEFAYGKALKAEDRMPGTIPVYGSSGIVGYHEESLVRGPGVIVGRKGNVGTVYWSESDFYPIDTVFYVRTDLSLPYVCYNLSGQRFLNSDAAVPGLRRQQAYLLDFLKPPDDLLKKFEQWARPLFREKCLLERTNIILRRTRERLLPGLISGEIDVAGWSAGEEPEMAPVLARRVAEAAGPVEPVGREGMAWKALWE